jgi:hypothetical protein
MAPRKRFDGQVFLVFLGAYSALRYAVEALRNDDRGGALGHEHLAAHLRLRSFRLFDASAGTVVMPAVGLDALQSAVAGAMGLVQPEAGHIVLLARESSDPTARGLAGVRVQPVSEASAVYYDSVLNPEALQLGDAQTGPLGLAVLLNLTAPTMGVREVSMQVTGPTGSVTARVPVLARTVTWVTFTPGR